FCLSRSECLEEAVFVALTIYHFRPECFCDVVARKLIKSGIPLISPPVEAGSHGGEGKKQLEIEGADDCSFSVDLQQGEVGIVTEC
ncbi:hypothetical protein B296_00057595, partial [Ensete ventricosum]